MLIKNLKQITYNNAQRAYNNSKIIRKGCKLGKQSAKPVFEIKDIYIANKSKGTRTAIKEVMKQKGVCAPILTGVGALVGTFASVIPGTGLISAIGGYFIGHGIDICAKQLYKSVLRFRK